MVGVDTELIRAQGAHTVPKWHRFFPKVLVDASPKTRVWLGEVVPKDALLRREGVAAPVEPRVEALPAGSSGSELLSTDLTGSEILREFHPWVVRRPHKERSRPPTAASPEDSVTKEGGVPVTDLFGS